MTREEAIGKINAIKKYLTTGNPIWYVREINEVLDMAIEAIQAEPIVRCKDCISKPNNTCEVDLISREDAMGAVQDHFNADGFKGYYDGQKMMYRITALPSAEPKTGEWIPFNEKGRKGRAMSRVKITCEIHDYSEPSKPNIRIHSHWNEDTFVELEINDERYTVSAEEITRAIYNASNGGR